jgi:DNA-binding beta-propeller fold protein YncE
MRHRSRILVGLLVALVTASAVLAAPRRQIPAAGWVGTPVAFDGVPARLHLDAASGRVLVTDVTGGRAVAFDGGTLTPAGSFGTAGGRAEWLAATPGASTVFLLHADSGTLEALRTADGRALHREVIAGHAAGLALQPLSGRLFVSGAPRGTVVMLDAATFEPLGSRRTGREPTELLVNPQTDRLVVADRLDGTLTVLDADDLNLLEVLEVGPRPHRLALDPGANRIYVTDALEGGIRVVDGDTNRVVARIESGRLAAVAVDTAGKRLFVTDPERREVAVLHAGTHRRLDTIRLRGTPSGVAMDVARGRLWVAHRAEGALMVFWWVDPAE